MELAKKYQKLKPIEHILKRPGMWVGGVESIDNNVWILEKDNKITEKTISYPPGLYKIFDEIIVNAYDQTIRDPTVSNIKVAIDYKTNTMTVFNDGQGIDVAIHPIEKVYIPELIFSQLRTSTSFDDTDGKSRITGSVHGLGAKLTAVFSTYFKVDVGDPKNKKSFTQYYKNNLSFKSKPIIKKYDKKEGYVQIIFVPDLKYFGLDKLSDDLIKLMEKRVYDLAALVDKKIKVSLNGKRIQADTFDKYITLYTDEQQVKNACTISSDRWQITITKSKGKYKQISFVNSIYTNDGGKHVDYIVNQITKQMKDYIESKYKTSKIRSHFIKDQFWLFINSVIENPTFSSQTKGELISPPTKFGSVCEINPSFVKKIYKTLDYDTLIKHQIKFIQGVEISKLDKKPKKTVKGIPKLNDAQLAGTKKSNQCSLFLTEGDSAKTMAISGLSAIPNANKIYGVFPLKGKLLNVREAKHSQIINNEEFKNLKNILGLMKDKVYTPENIDELRYGTVVLMMDQDMDGSHIKGLFVNMIHYYWPSLLKIKGFVQIFITPIVKVTPKVGKKDSISFYNLTNYENWKKKIDENKWLIKYYKGLGTNTASEAQIYFQNLDKHLISIEWTPAADDAITLAFSKDRADDRKKWLKKYDREVVLNPDDNVITYKDFINKELIHFSNYDNIRSIPNVIDGLKPSKRKVLFGMIKKGLTGDIKVSQVVGYISEKTGYHHGEVSLTNTIINMAQTFVGSNNINLLEPNGQFGTRLMGGKDHSSPRYIFTNLEKVTRLIYPKEDDPLLNYLNDDGLDIEPEYFVPIIPMILVNGASGLGTGYSTYIPNYNPVDIIDSIERKLRGDRYREIKPYYKGFTGDIIKKDNQSYFAKGKYTITGNTLRITELPVTLWTETFKGYVETVLMEKGSVKNMLNNSTDTTVDFTIKLSEIVPDINNIEKMFGLVKIINTSNMHLFDQNNEIKKYPSTKQIIDEFFDVRLELYKKRKAYQLTNLRKDLDILEAKAKFIKLVISKKIDIFGKPRNTIVSILAKQKLFLVEKEQPYDYLIRMPIYTLTKEKIDELEKQLKEKKKLFLDLQKKSPKQLWIDDLNKLKQYIN